MTHTHEILMEINNRPIWVEVEFEVENDGIGHFEYSGATGFDSSPSIDILNLHSNDGTEEEYLNRNFKELSKEILRFHEEELIEYAQNYE